MLDYIIGLIQSRRRQSGMLPQDLAEAAAIASSELFDEAYFMGQADPADAQPEFSPMHYLKEAHTRRDPHELFQSEYYRSQAVDLEPDANPLIHYLESGPSSRLRPHPDFDPEAYVRSHPEILETGLTPLEHQLHYARKQKAVVFAPLRKQFCFERGRYLYLLAKSFEEIGCRIYMLRESDLIRQRERFHFFDYLASVPWVTLLEDISQMPDAAVVITDDARLETKADTILWQRSRPWKGGSPYLFAFTMHARQYQQGRHRCLCWYRTRPKTTEIYFAGQNDWMYAIPFLPLKFRMLARKTLIRLLRKHFRALIDPTIEKHYQLKFRPPGSPPIVLADKRTQRCASALWLEQLSHADFFLALPGSYFPMAHNVIEAMAVGTIPVLAYHHYFHPKLKDGENCLTYADGKSFVAAIQRALSMSAEEKSRLRKNVIAYYERSIEFKKRAQKLLDDPASSKQLYFPYEYRLQPDWDDAIHD